MGMEQTKLFTCDRCGYKTTEPEEWKDKESGCCYDLTFRCEIYKKNGDEESVERTRTVIQSGDAYWLCLKCSKDFIKFFKNENME